MSSAQAPPKNRPAHPRFLAGLVVMLLVAAVLISPVGLEPALADEVAEWEEMLKAWEEQMEERDQHLQQIEATEEEIGALEQAVASLEGSILQREQRIRQLEAEANAIATTIQQREQRLVELEEQVDRRNELLGERLRRTYMNGFLNFSYLRIFLNAENVTDLVMRVEYVRRIVAEERRMISQLRHERNQVEEERAQIEASFLRLQNIRQQLAAERDSLQASRAATQAQLEDRMSLLDQMIADLPPEPPPPPPPPAGVDLSPTPGDLMLGWRFVTMQNTNFVNTPPSESGYNIFAPVAYRISANSDTVFRLSGTQGLIATANANGYRTWVTIQQFGETRLRQIFSDPDRQTALIQHLMEVALADEVDGINVNFENMGTDPFMRAGFTNFMAALYEETQAAGLYLSTAVTRPGNTSWSAAYDHGALAQVTDYIQVMAYDQHTMGTGAGPVAGLPWTETAITSTLSRGVPPEKLMLGVPFYSREWRFEGWDEESVVLTHNSVNLREAPNTDNAPVTQANSGSHFPYLATVEGEEIDGNNLWYRFEHSSHGELYVFSGLATIGTQGTSLAGMIHISMEVCLQIVQNFDPQTGTSHYQLGGNTVHLQDVSFSDSHGLTLAEYRKVGNPYFYQVWLENYDSLRKRYALKEEYGLAGIAVWSLEWQDHDRRAFYEMSQ